MSKAPVTDPLAKPVPAARSTTDDEERIIRSILSVVYHDVRAAAEKDLRDLLAGEYGPQAGPVKYGCHCDLETMDPGYAPDDCVMDRGDYADCVYAGILHSEGKTKHACQYWQPVTVHKGSAQ
jgi:hypothetical protein